MRILKEFFPHICILSLIFNALVLFGFVFKPLPEDKRDLNHAAVIGWKECQENYARLLNSKVGGK